MTESQLITELLEALSMLLHEVENPSGPKALSLAKDYAKAAIQKAVTK